MQCPLLFGCYAIAETNIFRYFPSLYHTSSNIPRYLSTHPSVLLNEGLSPSIFRLVLKKTGLQVTISQSEYLGVLLNFLHTFNKNWWGLVSIDRPHRLLMAEHLAVAFTAPKWERMWLSYFSNYWSSVIPPSLPPPPLAKRIILIWKIMLGTFTSFFPDV